MPYVLSGNHFCYSYADSNFCAIFPVVMYHTWIVALLKLLDFDVCNIEISPWAISFSDNGLSSFCPFLFPFTTYCNSFGYLCVTYK